MGWGLVDRNVINELEIICGSEDVIHSPAGLAQYRSDASHMEGLPSVVVFPQSAEEVSRILKLASQKTIPVTPRGAGTGLSGGAIPRYGGILLVMTKMDRIKTISKDDLYAIVEPGVVTARLDALAREKGLTYPPDPASYETSTIGGNIAECSGGLRGLKYGVTRDYVLGLEYVLASGEVARSGSAAYKCVCGFDITRLLVGSEGTLAVITQATLKLLPLPPYRLSFSALFRNLRDGMVFVEKIRKSGIMPATLEIMDEVTLKAVMEYLGEKVNGGAMVLFEVDGDDLPGLERELGKAITMADELGAIEKRPALDPATRDEVWKRRRSIHGALARIRPNMIAEDIAVPFSKLVPMIDSIREIEKEFSVIIAAFGHAGDGNIHADVLVDLEDEDEKNRARLASEKIVRTALLLGGTVTGEHGIGMTKSKFMLEEIGPAGVEVMRRIKRAFDPEGILNPGKMLL